MPTLQRSGSHALEAQNATAPMFLPLHQSPNDGENQSPTPCRTPLPNAATSKQAKSYAQIEGRKEAVGIAWRSTAEEKVIRVLVHSDSSG